MYLFVHIKSNFRMLKHSLTIPRASEIHEEEANFSASLEKLFGFDIIASRQLTKREAREFGYRDIFWEGRVFVKVLGRGHIRK